MIIVYYILSNTNIIMYAITSWLWTQRDSTVNSSPMKESLKVYIIIYAIDTFFKLTNKHNFVLKPFVMLEEKTF